MNKRTLILALTITLLFTFFLSLHSCIINNPKPEECEIKTIKITEISERPGFDIVFNESSKDNFYINRGLENGLNLDSLNANILNKTVTLHLPKLFYGTSNHIAQLAIDNEIIFTEFSSNADAKED